MELSSRRTSSSPLGGGATPSPLTRRTTQPRRDSVKIRGMSEDLDDFEVEKEEEEEEEEEKKVEEKEEEEEEKGVHDDDDCV